MLLDGYSSRLMKCCELVWLEEGMVVADWELVFVVVSSFGMVQADASPAQMTDETRVDDGWW